MLVPDTIVFDGMLTESVGEVVGAVEEPDPPPQAASVRHRPPSSADEDRMSDLLLLVRLDVSRAWRERISIVRRRSVP